MTEPQLSPIFIASQLLQYHNSQEMARFYVVQLCGEAAKAAVSGSPLHDTPDAEYAH